MNHNNESRKTVLIQNEIDAINALFSVLKQEFEAFKTSTNAEDITHLAIKKEQLLAAMEVATQQRILGITTSDPDLLTEPLRSMWETLLTLAKSCQHLNQINGGIINTTKRHVEQATTILHGQLPTSELRYGSSGETVAETSQRSLAKA